MIAKAAEFELDLAGALSGFWQRLFGPLLAITTAMVTSFKLELMQAIHDLTGGSPSGDMFKLALIKANPNASYGAATTNYSDLSAQSPQDEVADSGSYVAGGGELVGVGGFPQASGTTIIHDFNDIAFTSATISADGCIIYNASKANRAASVHDFGGTKTSTNGTFTVSMPAADASNAVLRIA
jgi:hypothetical protein